LPIERGDDDSSASSFGGVSGRLQSVFIAAARPNWLRRILRKSIVGLRQLAKQKARAFARDDRFHVRARFAQALRRHDLLTLVGLQIR
jgi:hypothetical protein